MGLKSFNEGTVIYDEGQEIECLYLIASGTVRASFDTGSFILKKGDIVGLADLNFKETFLKYEVVEKCSVMEYKFTPGRLNEILTNNKDATRYFIVSLFRQLAELSGHYKLLKNEFNSLRDYLVTGYEDYVMICEKLTISPSELAEYEEVASYSLDELLPDWITGYYSSLQDIVLSSESATKDPDFITGLITKSGRDLREMVSHSSELESNKTDILNLLMNENSVDLFEMYLSLYMKAIKKLGLDDPTVGQIFRQINDLLLQAETQGLDKEPFFATRRSQYEGAMKLATELAANQENLEEEHGAEQLELVANSLTTILQYASVDEELASAFANNVKAYKHTVNKNGSEDDIRVLRLHLTKEFNQIYIEAFKKAAKDYAVPTILKMFFNFGYVDEELIGIDNAIYLYNLTEKLPTAPDQGIYSYFEWLMEIYDGRKDPSRNEFEMDYADYLHDEMRNQRITKEQEQEFFNDPEMRVTYELENAFVSTNKVTTGRISTYCPLLSEHNMLKSLDSMLVKEDELTKIVNRIRMVDYGAYYRQTVFAAPDQGINKEFVDVEIVPDFILLPNIGSRGIMWQEIEGKRRTTPGRMCISIFQQEDLASQIVRLTGQFRWEMCKRVQGARWNDVTERSLTSEYFDYVQYYRKNNELSPEAKEKIKNDMARCKNSFREMFVRDYMTWVQFESEGAPRLNKVSRAILFTYVPFGAACREKLKINPMYKDMIDRYDVKQKSKMHRMDNIVQKLKNLGKPIPEEIEKQIEFLKA